MSIFDRNIIQLVVSKAELASEAEEFLDFFHPLDGLVDFIDGLAKADRSRIVVLSKGNFESIQVFFKVGDIDILFTDKR